MVLKTGTGSSKPAVSRGMGVLLGAAFLLAVGALAALTVQKQQPYYDSLKQRPVVRFLQRLQTRLSSE